MDKGRPHPALGLPIAAVLLLLVGPIVGATPDDEEYRNAIISLVLHARALLDGVYPVLDVIARLRAAPPAAPGSADASLRYCCSDSLPPTPQRGCCMPRTRSSVSSAAGGSCARSVPGRGQPDWRARRGRCQRHPRTTRSPTSGPRHSSSGPARRIYGSQPSACSTLRAAAGDGLTRLHSDWSRV